MLNQLEEYLRDISLNLRRERELLLNRRGFIATAVSLAGVMFLSSLPFVWKALKNAVEAKEEASYKIADIDELQVGQSKVFTYPHEHEPAMLIRLSPDTYRSYHIKCTHLQCPVYYDGPTNRLICPCHHGFFNVEDGVPMAGPPPRPLPRIQLDFRKDGIYAVGVEEIEGGVTS